ncbi:MAG: argininosuccinate synthase [Candidatus Firestonebacteria bacterium RIFOXYC2_FULL_39_67]|nr:MAG: argininosuccinate synthase [Candidatus Firestonebacteria bacterium RIFOXYD2_FULL_39_29]OGF55115.1 MAG: argininosuccinate synthase [Candidatus Firestonebacteria bacterium RIFOXYC2_FULL_39_67]
MNNIKKVVLAYSGGLDTSIIIPWLKENYHCEVIACAVDVGQGEELSPLKKKAIKTGASKIYIIDAKKEFVTDYIWPSLKANAIYEGRYLLGTSFARPIIAEKIVEVAKKEKADAVCHGATGKGNDQVRFELTFKALNPDLKIIAPWREWDIQSREEEIEYAEARGISVPVTKKKPYSMDRNLWHISYEGGILEKTWNEYKDDMFLYTVSPEKAPNKPTFVEIFFEKGIPKKLNGKAYGPVEMIFKLNDIAGKNGVGRVDIVENRLVGMKSRGVYETPAGTVLHAALRDLECITLDKETLHYKELIAPRYAELVYNGQWQSELRSSFDAFINHAMRNTTGTVKMKLYKGNCLAVARKSEYSLYDENIATFSKDEVYNQKDAEGFINLFGLSTKVGGILKRAKKIK